LPPAGTSTWAERGGVLPPIIKLIDSEALPVYRQVTDSLARQFKVEPITFRGATRSITTALPISLTYSVRFCGASWRSDVHEIPGVGRQ